MHPPHTPDDASRIQQNIIHKTPTQLPTYSNASRTRRTPPTPDDASRMQYRHKTCQPWPWPHSLLLLDGTRLALALAVIWRCARPYWSAFCCTSLSRRRASFLWTCYSSSARCSSSPRRSSSSLSARTSPSWSWLALSLAERLATSLAAERLVSALWRS